jgi:hypothetical protein
MLPNSQAQPQPRWTTFVQRWDERLSQFRNYFDPTTPAPVRPMQTWAIVALSAGLIVLAVLMAFGTMWVISHNKWGLIFPLLKVGKWLVLGLAIVGAILFRDKLMPKSGSPMAKRNGA